MTVTAATASRIQTTLRSNRNWRRALLATTVLSAALLGLTGCVYLPSSAGHAATKLSFVDIVWPGDDKSPAKPRKTYTVEPVECTGTTCPLRRSQYSLSEPFSAWKAQ